MATTASRATRASVQQRNYWARVRELQREGHSVDEARMIIRRAKLDQAEPVVARPARSAQPVAKQPATRPTAAPPTANTTAEEIATLAERRLDSLNEEERSLATRLDFVQSEIVRWQSILGAALPPVDQEANGEPQEMEAPSL